MGSLKNVLRTYQVRHILFHFQHWSPEQWPCSTANSRMLKPLGTHRSYHEKRPIVSGNNKNDCSKWSCSSHNRERFVNTSCRSSTWLLTGLLWELPAVHLTHDSLLGKLLSQNCLSLKIPQVVFLSRNSPRLPTFSASTYSKKLNLVVWHPAITAALSLCQENSPSVSTSSISFSDR